MTRKPKTTEEINAALQQAAERRKRKAKRVRAILTGSHRAKQAGINAHKLGLKLSHCPYRHATFAKAWREGWKERAMELEWQQYHDAIERAKQ